APLPRNRERRVDSKNLFPPRSVLFCGRENVQPSQFRELVQRNIGEAAALHQLNEFRCYAEYPQFYKLFGCYAIITSILNRSYEPRRHAMNPECHQLRRSQAWVTHDLQFLDHRGSDTVNPERQQIID